MYNLESSLTFPGVILSGVIGALTLPLAGFAAVSAAAGSLGLIAAVCATGGAIVLAPVLILNTIIDLAVNKKEDPLTYFLLKILLAVGAAAAAVFIGAAIFSAMANPIALCVVAGTITVMIAGVALAAIFGLIDGPAVCCVAGSACCFFSAQDGANLGGNAFSTVLELS